jgi:hypothetical protein
MTAAIFGLAGVLVGGVLSSAGEAWLDRRRQLLEGMAAARLVSTELDALRREVDWILESRVVSASPDVPVDLWGEHRAALAAVLSSADWRRVARAQVAAALVSHLARQASDPVSPEALEPLGVSAKLVAAARDVLNEVGDGRRLTRAQRAMFRATGGWLRE